MAWKTLPVIVSTDTNLWNYLGTFPDKKEGLANVWRTKIHTLTSICFIFHSTEDRMDALSSLRQSRWLHRQGPGTSPCSNTVDLIVFSSFKWRGSPPASLLTVKGSRDSADAVLSGSWVQDALCSRRQCSVRSSRRFWRCGNRLPSAASGLTYKNPPRELYLGDNCSTN